jgi:hypothetical protein
MLIKIKIISQVSWKNAYNSSSQVAEAGRSQVQGQPGLHSIIQSQIIIIIK